MADGIFKDGLFVVIKREKVQVPPDVVKHLVEVVSEDKVKITQPAKKKVGAHLFSFLKKKTTGAKLSFGKTYKIWRESPSVAVSK
jgi:hypothetical protein